MKSNDAEYRKKGYVPPVEKDLSENRSNELDSRVQHKPWSNSTGPRSTAGKARSRLNSQKFGIWGKGPLLCRREACPMASQCFFRGKPDLWNALELGGECPYEAETAIVTWKGFIDYPELEQDVEYCELVEAFIEATIRGRRIDIAVSHAGGRMSHTVERRRDGKLVMFTELTPEFRLNLRFLHKRMRLIKKIEEKRNQILNTKIRANSLELI